MFDPINFTIENILPNTRPENTNVAVAMSGGVDSSTVAVLLKKMKYNVIGITMKLYSGLTNGNNPKTCCSGRDINDASDVANKFNFRHYVVNYEEEFKRDVIDYFANEYSEAKTPIPCIRCNQTVKFEYLLKAAKDIGCHALVTGHYVRRVVNPDGSIEMHSGIDLNKDQSYFLFATTYQQLEYLRFPLGGLHKINTRSLAKHYEISTHDKVESKGICFVTEGNYVNFLDKINQSMRTQGSIVNAEGNILGKHSGIYRYTIGQRRGLGISAGRPLYVIDINKDKNEVVVGDKDSIAFQSIKLADINWIKHTPDFYYNREVEIKIRSTGPKIKALMKQCDGTIYLDMIGSNREAISPGQACVVYEDSCLLGGGWIC